MENFEKKLERRVHHGSELPRGNEGDGKENAEGERKVFSSEELRALSKKAEREIVGSGSVGKKLSPSEVNAIIARVEEFKAVRLSGGESDEGKEADDETKEAPQSLEALAVSDQKIVEDYVFTYSAKNKTGVIREMLDDLPKNIALTILRDIQDTLLSVESEANDENTLMIKRQEVGVRIAQQIDEAWETLEEAETA